MQGTRPYDGVAFHRNSESRCDDRIRRRALDTSEAQLVSQALVRHAQVPHATSRRPLLKPFTWASMSVLISAGSSLVTVIL
jgi:hypothetical protein